MATTKVSEDLFDKALWPHHDDYHQECLKNKASYKDFVSIDAKQSTADILKMAMDKIVPLLPKKGGAVDVTAGAGVTAAKPSAVPWKVEERPVNHLGLVAHWPAPKGAGGAKNAILISTGAFNPVHSGHVQMMKSAAERLQKENITCISAYLSPTHDAYVQKKYQDLGEIAFNGAFRYAAIKAACVGEGLVDVAGWEVFNDKFVDYPDVAKQLQKEAGTTQVFYVCGSDHAEKQGLGNGLPGGLGVVIVPRTGALAWKRDIPENPGKNVYVAQNCGALAALSSAQVRASLKQGTSELNNFIGKGAADFLAHPNEQHVNAFREEYQKMGVGGGKDGARDMKFDKHMIHTWDSGKSNIFDVLASKDGLNMIFSQKEPSGNMLVAELQYSPDNTHGEWYLGKVAGKGTIRMQRCKAELLFNFRAEGTDKWGQDGRCSIKK